MSRISMLDIREHSFLIYSKVSLSMYLISTAITPYTLYPTPYTLFLIPYTLHLTPCTLHVYLIP